MEYKNLEQAKRDQEVQTLLWPPTVLRRNLAW